MSQYQVKRFPPHGIAIIGEIPVSELVVLLKAWGEQGYTLLDIVIAEHLRASFVAVKSVEGAEAWKKQLGIGVDNPDRANAGASAACGMEEGE